MANNLLVITFLALFVVAFADPAKPGESNTDGEPQDGEENKEKYFEKPDDWYKDFKKRFDAVLQQIPSRSSNPQVQRNIQIANSWADEISRLNGRKQSFMGRGNVGAVQFMTGQEKRNNRLGLFVNPMTWTTVPCGAGYIQAECGSAPKAGGGGDEGGAEPSDAPKPTDGWWNDDYAFNVSERLRSKRCDWK